VQTSNPQRKIVQLREFGCWSILANRFLAGERFSLTQRCAPSSIVSWPFSNLPAPPKSLLKYSPPLRLKSPKAANAGNGKP